MTHHKLITLAEAVRRYTHDGIQYASGAALPVGSDAVVFGRELLRQQRQDLHAIFHCNTQQLNLLAGAGAVSKAECGFSGLEVFGFANGLRRAVETGQTALEDYSNLAMALRLLGGALNWPFVPATVNIGSDIQYRSAFAPDEYPAKSKIPTVTDPFSGKEIGAFSPLQPEIAAIHVSLADPLGNAILLGTEWSRFELARAAKKVILIADAIVDTDCMRQFPNLVRIPDVIVDAVVYHPFAAWPQSSPGFYDADEAHMKFMNKSLSTAEATADYLRDYVTGIDDLDAYLDRIGRDKVEQLAATATAFLVDPFRQWIKTPEEIAELLAQNVGGKRMSDLPYTRQEMMAIATGRELHDGELAIFGVGLSMLAGYFAQACHAPRLRSMTEGGVYGATPVGGLPWGIECNRISANATSFTNALDALGFLVASGRCDVGIIGAAQVNKFGNVNTTGIWDGDIGDSYRPPKTRLTGAGGANDIACGAGRVVIMVTHEPKRFAEQVTYISSPGYLDGGNARDKFGFVGGGPSAIVTTLGILRPDPVSKEFFLDAYYAFSSIEEIRAATGWDLKVSPDVHVVPEPTPEELAALRRVDETGALRKQ